MFLLKYLGSVVGGIVGAIFILLLAPVLAIFIMVYGILGRVSLFKKDKDGGLTFVNIKG